MKAELKQIIDFRTMNSGDEAFIFSTWLKGLRYGNDWFGFIPANIYYRVYHKMLETILDNSRTFVAVVCLKEDPSVIIAYSVRSDDVLHWVFVKPEWRSAGIAKAICQGITTASHITKSGKAICHKHKITFNPFAA